MDGGLAISKNFQFFLVIRSDPDQLLTYLDTCRGTASSPVVRLGCYIYIRSGSSIGSSDFDLFLEIQCASCVFGLALKSLDLFIKKCFFNIERFLSYLTFYPSFFEIGRAGYQKKRNFVLISKMWRSLEFGKGKKMYRKT